MPRTNPYADLLEVYSEEISDNKFDRKKAKAFAYSIDPEDELNVTEFAVYETDAHHSPAARP